MRSKLREVFALDVRALALFRMSMATLVCADIVLRLNDLNAFYSDQGWMLGDHAQSPTLWHLQLCWHRANTSAVFQVKTTWKAKKTITKTTDNSFCLYFRLYCL